MGSSQGYRPPQPGVEGLRAGDGDNARMKTSERISQAADRIEEVLQGHREARADPEAMAALRSAAAELGARDPFSSGKLVELMDHAQTFYSRRTLFRMPSRSQRLWSEMRDGLDLLRMRARVLAAQGD